MVDSVLRLLLARGDKVLIFSGMVRMLDLLATFVECGGYGGYIRIDGSTPALERHSQVLAFNDTASKSSPSIALLSTRAAGLGLNLASASTVILYDSDWNPQMDLQAQDRAHRLGSTQEVFVLRLLTPASVEISKWDRAQKKTVLTNVVMPRHKFKGEDDGGDEGRGAGGAAGEREFLEELKVGSIVSDTLHSLPLLLVHFSLTLLSLCACVAYVRQGAAATEGRGGFDRRRGGVEQGGEEGAEEGGRAEGG